MTFTKEQLTGIIESAEDVLQALAGTHEDIHPESKKMIEAWDHLNDRAAPPEVVKRLAEITLAALTAEPVAVVPDIGEIRIGRLPTMNQDDYPGLGDWWVQLRIGKDSDEVLARVYGATPQEANSRAEALACRAAMLQGKAEPVSQRLGGPGGVHAKNEPHKLIGAGDIPYGGAGDDLTSRGNGGGK